MSSKKKSKKGKGIKKKKKVKIINESFEICSGNMQISKDTYSVKWTGKKSQTIGQVSKGWATALCKNIILPNSDEYCKYEWKIKSNTNFAWIGITSTGSEELILDEILRGRPVYSCPFRPHYLVNGRGICYGKWSTTVGYMSGADKKIDNNFNSCGTFTISINFLEQTFSVIQNGKTMGVLKDEEMVSNAKSWRFGVSLCEGLKGDEPSKIQILGYTAFKKDKMVESKTDAIVESKESDIEKQPSEKIVIVETQSKEIKTMKSEIMYFKDVIVMLKDDKSELKKQVNNLSKEMDDEKLGSKDFKTETVYLKDKINQYMNKYKKNKLLEMYNNNSESISIEKELKELQMANKLFGKSLEDIESYISLISKPNILEYESWSVDKIIIWIKSLDNGKYDKYCDILRNGFESDEIRGEQLPMIDQKDLRAPPFEIKSFEDRKLLSQHFKSLVLK